MSRHYSIKTFIRSVPRDLMKQYFAKAKIKLPIPWSKIHEGDADPLCAAIQDLTAEQRAVIDSDFAMINELACPDGTSAIREQATLHGLSWADGLSHLENEYARAFWTFLKHRAHFEAAGAFHDMDRSGAGWRRFVGKRLSAATEGRAMKAFSSYLEGYYWIREAARYCKIDVYRRANPERVCYFAYPEGMATSDLGYDDKGRFLRRPHRSALEVVFVYRPEEGVLELHPRGLKREREELAKAFCVAILGLNGLPDTRGRTPYDLSCLKDPHFPFSTNPKDGVEGVELRLLRLDLPGDETKGIGRRILLSATDSPRARNAVHQLLADAINPRKVWLDDVLIAQAKLTMVFRASGNRRTKRLTFEIKYPDRCTLKDDHYDQIAKKYLKRWGIARD